MKKLSTRGKWTLLAVILLTLLGGAKAAVIRPAESRRPAEPETTVTAR